LDGCRRKHKYSLHLIAKNGHIEIIKYLVDKGANIRTNIDTTLQLSAKHGHLEIVKYLVEEHRAVIDDCVILLSAKKGHLEVVKYLVLRQYLYIDKMSSICK